jgi:hypothetical protein
MAQYPIPTTGYATYNGDIFQPPGANQGLTVEDGKKYFVTYPTSQAGTQTFSDVDVVGTFAANSTSEFDGTLTVKNSNFLLNGVDGTNYIQFPDGTKQYTATQDKTGYALLAGGTSSVPQVFSGYDQFENQTIFNGDNTTVQNTGIIKFVNTNTNSSGTLYQDATGGNDMTLWSSNTTGGLTVRNPSYSFTVNPTSGNVASFTNPVSTDYSITGGSFISSQTTLKQDPNNNPQIFSFVNAYNGTTQPQFYFQLQNTTNTGYICPMQITNSEVDVNENLNVRGTVTSNLNVYTPGNNTALYTGIRTDGINSIFSNNNFDGTNYGTTYFQNTDGTSIHNVLQINKDGVSCTYGGLGVYAGNLNVNAGYVGNFYDTTNTNSSSIQQNGANTIMRNNSGGIIYFQGTGGVNGLSMYQGGLTFYNNANTTQTGLIQQQGINLVITNNTSGGAVYIQTTPSGNTAYFNSTGLTVAVGGVTVPTLGTYPLANSNGVATITYVNQAIAAKPTVVTLLATPAPTSFSYIVGLNTVTYQYTNYNTTYASTSALEISSNGNKRVSWIPQRSGVTNNYPFQLAYPKITSGGVVNTNPTSIILTYFDITNYYTQYNWTGTNYTQVYIYCVTGTTTVSQACTYYTQVLQSGSSYFLGLILSTQTDIGTFNGSTVYYIPNLSINWW